jgi:UDP-N-acetylmuramoyl-tripeptide--D-alanyl-D-alanine ligase
LFVALTGDRTDGHRYLAKAAESGACVLLVNQNARSVYESQRLFTQNVSVIAVEDTLRALQQLASAWVRRFPSLVKLAVTGSSGKTTTKEMLSSILSEMGNTVKNPGNYNSVIGLPLSVFGINDEHEFGVFEMGINHAGEMDNMLDVYAPDVSVMTNIGTAHIGLLGSTEAIAREKSKIFHKRLVSGFIHEDNIWRPYIEQKRSVRLNQFGLGATDGVENAVSLGLNGWRLTYQGIDIHLTHVGLHNLYDALAAIEVAQSLGAERHDVRNGLEKLQPLNGRSRIINGRVTVIEDSYNSNVESAGNILNYLGLLPWNGHKHVVLGSMKELGFATMSAHSAIGRQVSSLNVQGTFLFGKEMESAFNYLKREAYANTLYFTDDYDELEHQVTSHVRGGDLVLLKGSRAMAMERLVEPLSLVS